VKIVNAKREVHIVQKLSVLILSSRDIGSYEAEIDLPLLYTLRQGAPY
jgi:hypothetical protein